MKVRIAFATLPDGHGGHTIDANRIGAIEDHPEADAKALIKQGVAGPVTDADVAEWEALEAHRKATAEADPKAAEPDGVPVEKTEPAAPQKMRRNRVSGQYEPDTTPVVTVAPGAESSPDVDPADRTK